MEFKAPKIDSRSFTCPNCSTFSEQTWSTGVNINYRSTEPNGQQVFRTYTLIDYRVCKCTNCGDISIWKKGKMIIPVEGNIPNPNLDMPENIKEDYLEAKLIVNLSPRGAAALLRLAIQKLCIHLGEKGKNINEDIKQLVEKGLPVTIQKALDSVRVIGNNAVHPGYIDLKDNQEIAYKLFGFINVICDVLITQPKKIEEFYNLNLSDGTKKAIDDRDGK